MDRLNTPPTWRPDYIIPTESFSDDTGFRMTEFLDLLNGAHVHSIELHLILDNSSTHKAPEVNRWLETQSTVQAALHSYEHLVAQRC